jgi:hypothetical protein
MLPFISTLIWQIILVACLWAFRSELRSLLKRILSVKHGNTEVLFQQPSPDALEPSPLASEVLKIRDEGGFFTKQGVENIVKESKYFRKDNTLKDSILVFSTEKQRTWLVATDSHVYFILDDECTRSSQRLIQTLIPLEEALPVHAQREDNLSGSFRLGKSAYWYYSFDLVGAPANATQRLSKFVNTIRNG